MNQNYLPTVEQKGVFRDSIALNSEQFSRELSLCSTEEARRLVDYEVALKNFFLPLGLIAIGDRKILNGVIASPIKACSIKELSFICGYEVNVEELDSATVQKAIHLAYNGSKEFLLEAVNESNKRYQHKDILNCKLAHSINDCTSKAGLQAGAPKLLNRILDRALFLNASDIHIEPNKEEARVRFRIDGMLREESSLRITLDSAQALSRRIKVLAKLDFSMINSVQEGGFSFESNDWKLRIRVSLVPQYEAEKIVLRLLYNSFLDSLEKDGDALLEQLGLSQEQEYQLKASLALDHGAIILSGPTGSGKSTLLYASLLQIKAENKNIITLEDPVERQIPGVNQIEVSADSSKGNVQGFAQWLPKLLRQDPDVIMLGEIRDIETAQTALNAAIAGSLVLSTVHAFDCVAALSRLAQLGVGGLLAAASLKLVISQRLVPLNCKACLKEIKSNHALARLFGIPDGEILFASKGCEQCAHLKIKGRKGVFELLPIIGRLRKYLETENSQTRTMFHHEQLRLLGREYGYKSYVCSVRQALIQGEISPYFALRCVGMNPELLGYEN